MDAQVYKLLSLKELAISFNKNKIVELKETLLSSGKKSPYYMDMRDLLAFPELMTDIIERMSYRIATSGVEFDKLASVPVGAVPFASQLAGKMGKASVLIRDQPKQHGTKKLIEGRLGIDDRVILIEDVITTGASVIKTIQKLKNRGAEVVAVWALLNREEGGLENIAYEYKDIPVHALFTTTDIFTALVKEKLIAAYDWERIRYFQESQYKDMIRQMREKNTAKQAPEWETNRALYFATRFPHWIALQRPTPSNLILSLDKPTNVLNASQIVNILTKNRVPVPLIHSSCKNLLQNTNTLCQWHKETGGKLIYDSGVILGWNTNSSCVELDKINPNCHDSNGVEINIKYEVATNHILISSAADIASAIETLKIHNERYTDCGQRYKFIVLEFNKVSVRELVNDDTIWQSLDKLVDAMTGNNLGCCGVAFKYSDVRLMSGGRDLWKRAPVALWIDDWFLHPSMVSADKEGSIANDYYKSWTEMNSTMERLHPWQIVMDADAISGVYPVIDRLGQYSQFFKADQITTLINEIHDKIYKQSPHTTNPSEEVQSNISNDPIDTAITDATRYFKTINRELAHMREFQNTTTITGSKTKTPQSENSHSSQLVTNTHSNNMMMQSANEICTGLYSYCRQGVEWVWTQASDIWEARRLVAEQRLSKTEQVRNKKKN
jgi:orotate phosphoribosyltransferase